MTGNKQDTIVAVSTPPGFGAISIVRLSGPDSLKIAKKFFVPSRREILPRHATLGRVFDGKELVDEVILIYYKAPESYTGEDMVELNCHGSPYIVEQIVRLSLHNGARAAEPGEFTKRAFLNGKMELTQAEAVADLISSLTRTSHKASLSLLEGKLGKKISFLRQQLIDLIALLELELDFQEEDVENIPRSELLKRLKELKTTLNSLVKNYNFGKLIQQGIKVAIVGPPNSGKSTLLNAFLKEERAITSPIPGTTRDYIQEAVSINGYLFLLVDTAGLRDTEDEIEKAGIEKTRRLMNSSEIILYVIDASNPHDIEHAKNIREIKASSTIIALNKIDKVPERKTEAILQTFKDQQAIGISSKYGIGIHQLAELMIEKIKNKYPETGDFILINQRHYKELNDARRAIQNAINSTKRDMPPEIIVTDLRIALEHFDRILGKTTNDDILDSIFSRFCIGK